MTKLYAVSSVWVAAKSPMRHCLRIISATSEEEALGINLTRLGNHQMKKDGYSLLTALADECIESPPEIDA